MIPLHAPQILGALMVTAVMGGIFVMTVQMDGLREALAGWAFALGMTALLVGGLALMLGGLS